MLQARLGKDFVKQHLKPIDVGKQVHEVCHHYLQHCCCVRSRCPSDGKRPA
jgi:hypothetical protein